MHALVMEMNFLVWLNKQASILIDNRLKRKEKDYYSNIEAFNLDAAAIHKKLLLEIDMQQFSVITQYVNQFISHTTIWFMKFKTNLQNLEVVTLQLLHLHFIFDMLPQNMCSKERTKFTALQALFPTLSDYALKQYDIHYAKINAVLQA